ncbi:PilZ domain-containing protein [bacterium]|nr:PilZ domain-containing protein [bacterium]MCP5462198.1 PilZ domain-containing protein [bacterium]
MKDRRQYKRYYQNIPVLIEYDGMLLDGKLADLSMTGAGCYIQQRLPLYAEITIHFLADDTLEDKDDEQFSCQGAVIRCCKVDNSHDYQLGIFFTHLSEEILSHIMDLAYY